VRRIRSRDSPAALRQVRHNRWSATAAELPFAGRKVQIQRPRVRKAKGGGEVTLPAIAEFRHGDPVPEHVLFPQERGEVGLSSHGCPEDLMPA
jgi:hypothetical protein